METKTRIVGIVVNDQHELLLQKGVGYDNLWTPGGKLEEGESDIECLKREFLEEMNVTVTNEKRFGEFGGKSFYKDHFVINRVYIVQISGEVKPGAEIEELYWVSKIEYITGKYKMLPANEEIFERLIKEGIW